MHNDYSVDRRRLYILPTRIGWYFSLILFALFGIAIKYDNQAAFMMLFILVALGIIAMHQTHNNVIGLGLQTQASKAVFVGETAIFPLHLINNSNKDRYAVWLSCGDFAKLSNLSAFSTQNIELTIAATQRGYLDCQPISLTSQFPIGLLFCWTKQFHSPQRCLVYPQPLDLLAVPEQHGEQGQHAQTTARKSNSQDYSGMKNYQAGDRLRDIHWPSLAKANKLVSIEYEQSNTNSLNLSWFALPAKMNTENKLSQLCYWVIQAEHAQQHYQLEMPKQTIKYNLGAAHYHECLSALALWTEDLTEV